MRVCFCASACGMCAVFVRERWVRGGWRGGTVGGDGGSAKFLRRSHAVHSCLPPPSPTPRSPALAVLSMCLPPLSIRTSGVAFLARLPVRVAAEVAVVAIELSREVEGN